MVRITITVYFVAFSGNTITLYQPRRIKNFAFISVFFFLLLACYLSRVHVDSCYISLLVFAHMTSTDHE